MSKRPIHQDALDRARESTATMAALEAAAVAGAHEHLRRSRVPNVRDTGGPDEPAA